MVEYDWARVPLIEGRTFDLPTGSTTDAAFEMPALPAGRYRLVFELVSEQVTWFGTPIAEDLVIP